MATKMDKQLLEFFSDFELEELESLSEHPDEIEIGTEFPDDDVIDEHLKVINYLIKKKVG